MLENMNQIVKKSLVALSFVLPMASCTSPQQNANNKSVVMSYTVDKFADLEILRYQVDGFEELSLQQKTLIYYLSQAAIEGRDILFDQNCRYNLSLRKTLEEVYEKYAGERTTEDFKAFEAYLKRVWFSNGIHHHYGEEKFFPTFSEDYFKQLLADAKVEPSLPMDTLIKVMFAPDFLAKKVNQTAGEDLMQTSANNYYYGVTQSEAEEFYAKMKTDDERPVAYGLNSRLVKNEDGTIEEQVYKVEGMYSAALEKVVFWLEKAATVAENPEQKAVIEKLVEYYKNGDLRTYDEYAILWVKDLDSQVDFVNGFTEVYGDPIGLKGSWESVVNFKNIAASHRTEVISKNAQWFEINSPTDAKYKKEEVKGVSAKVITAAMLGGDCYPSTPIGINLPNSNWIRKEHGSKSVTIENITDAYEKAAQGNGFGEEFVYSEVERELMKEYGGLSDNLHTDLHECLGHGSGKMMPGVQDDALKSYHSTIEETRADLFALYFIADDKMVELELLPNKEAYKAAYYKFMMNGLMTQLTRIEPGKTIEESHMRNRALIARYAFEKGQAEKVVEFVKENGKTYVKVNDYEKLRGLFGELLKEIQRIKSEGDFEAAKEMVEKYAVNVDADLHTEVLERFKALNIAPYKGFVNPVYTPVLDDKGEIIDIQIDYTEGYVEQMLRYSKEHSWL